MLCQSEDRFLLQDIAARLRKTNSNKKWHVVSENEWYDLPNEKAQAEAKKSRQLLHSNEENFTAERVQSE